MSDQPKNIGVSEDIESNSFRFYHLFNLIYDYKKLNISILCLSLFLSILYFQLAPSIYTASTLLVPTIGNLSQVDPVENILDNLDINITDPNDIKLESHLATLTSRQFLQGFIKEKNILPILIPGYKIRKNLQFIRFKKISYDEIAYKSFLRSMMISSQGNLIEVSLSLASRDLVAPLTNQLIDDLNQFIRNDVIRETEINIKYIEENLGRSSLVSLQPTFYNLIEKEIQRSMLANGNDQYAFTVLDRAFIPEYKSHPRFFMIVIPSLIFGSILALILSFIHSVYLKNADDFKEIL